MQILSRLSLSAVLLFLLGSWLLLQMTGARPLYLGVFFLLAVVFGFIDIRYRQNFKLRIIFLALTLLYVLVASMTTAVAGRQTGHYLVHDNALQLEASLEFLDQGLNPYVESYESTAMAEWEYIYLINGEKLKNPALTHNLKLPFHVVFSWPFYKLLPGFDQRFVYFIVFLIGGAALYFLLPRSEYLLPALTLYSLNPLAVKFLLNGRDDVFVLAWLLWTFVAIKYKKFTLASVAFGLAITSKHSAWLLAPFYLVYLYTVLPATNLKNKLRQLIRTTWPALAVVAAVALPFLSWNFSAFVEDVFLFPLGSLPDSYPINGYSLASIFVSLGRLASPMVSFPTWIPFLVIVVPVFIWLVRQLVKYKNLATLTLVYAVFLLVYWFTARFFHDSHMGFISQLLLVGYFLAQEQNQQATAAPGSIKTG